MGLEDRIQQGVSSQRIDISRLAAEGALEEAAQEIALVRETKEALMEQSDDLGNPLAVSARKTGRTVEEFKATLKESEKAKLEQKIAPPHEIDDEAEKASQEHPELNKQLLKQLIDKIKAVKTKEELLGIVHTFYPDPLLAEYALLFLSKITKGTLKTLVEEALESHRETFKTAIAAGENINEVVQEFMKKEVIRLLLEKTQHVKDKTELLEMIKLFYPDPTLASYALQVLSKSTLPPAKDIVDEALKTHEELFSRELAAEKNISESIQEHLRQSGVQTPTALRTLYRDITANPRNSHQMFIELSERYPYKELRKVTAFLLHSLGSDLKSQGPSIEPGRLHNLIVEVRALQTTLGVFQFFRARV